HRPSTGRSCPDRPAPRRFPFRPLSERLWSPGGHVIDPFAQREIWFLTGSQDLYGPETLEQVASQSQHVAGLLEEAGQVPVRIVWKPVLKDTAQIREMALAANSDPNCVGVIAWMHTFSPAKMW